ncbi:MAG: DUF4384 domain-containing protein [Candidatus Electrothrix sp. GM3_4]|nr:DUF4384 domain-containing protein [Candidatus Electrothrix sp. GM3_4]
MVFFEKRITKLAVSAVFLLLTSCADMNPHNVDVGLPNSTPDEKITSYTQALSRLGIMTAVYSQGVLIQSQDIADNTGAAAQTGAEIQKNITEIIKSALNSIGGGVTFIEYDPSFISNQVATGYSSFGNKAIPEVVLTGGITEFDRGLETRGTGTNLDAEADVSGLPSWVPNDAVGFGVGDTSKAGKARITLDFNLKNFETLASLPKMTVTNSMEVYKGLREKEVGVTLFGPTFGMKGSIKKVQGRHEAVRLLVQLSMIQMVGKYLSLPYWTLLGEDARVDQTVLDSIKDFYYNSNELSRIIQVQQWLFLYGHKVQLTGQMDSATRNALASVDPNAESSGSVNEKLFTKLYMDIPINRETLSRRKKLDKMLAALMSGEAIKSAETNQPVAQSPPSETSGRAAHEEKQVQSKATRKPRATTSSGFGKRLSDDEW